METKGVWILETKESANHNKKTFCVEVFADKNHALAEGVSKGLAYMDAGWELSDPESPYPEWSDMYADILAAKNGGDYDRALSLYVKWEKSTDFEWDGFTIKVYHRTIRGCEC